MANQSGGTAWGSVVRRLERCGPLGLRWSPLMARGAFGRRQISGQGRVVGLAAGVSDAQGWSESGRVPLPVGSHGTPVWIGPMMPPS